MLELVPGSDPLDEYMLTDMEGYILDHDGSRLLDQQGQPIWEG